MSRFVLHRLALPEQTQQRTGTQIRRNLAGQGALGGENAAVESISLEPGERSLVGSYRGLRAAMLAQRLEELFDAPLFDDGEVVAFYNSASASQVDGYYTLRNVDVEPSIPQTDTHQRFDGVLTKKGTRQTHWRSVTTAPVQLTTDFGSDTTGYVGVHANASKIIWFDPVGKEEVSASLVETRNAEHGDVEIYDTQAPTFTGSDVDPVLLYELDYSDEGAVDCRVYDDRGNASKTDGNGHLQWQSVFRPTHDVEGKFVVSNGLRRLTFDDANNSLTAEAWDEGTTSWTSTSLGASDWQLYDTDLTHVGIARVDAQVTFEDTTGGTLFRLDMRLHRGYNDPQWFVPPDETTNSGTTPSGLQTLLNPIANDDTVHPQDRHTLTARKDVRL